MKIKLLILAGFVLLITAFAVAPSIYAYVCDLGTTGGSPWSLNFTGNNGFNDLQYRSGPIGVSSVAAAPEYPGYPIESEYVPPATNDYIIGFKGPGTCDVEVIAATSHEEALDYAKQVCSDCMVEDLSNRNLARITAEPTPTGVNYMLSDERDAYCRLVE